MSDAVWSYGISASVYALLAVWCSTAWRGKAGQSGLNVALLATAVWSGFSASFAYGGLPTYGTALLAEVVRDGAWILFMLRLLGVVSGADERRLPLDFRALLWMVGLVGTGLALWVAYVSFMSHASAAVSTINWVTQVSLVVFVVLGLATLEQVYRNCATHYLWRYKFLLFGLAGIFAFDLYMYSSGLLLGSIEPTLWAARGAVCAFVAPLIAVSVSRGSQVDSRIGISRHVIFHTATLFAAGVYLVMMAAAGYYIQIFGGDWGGIAQTVFLFLALIALALLLASGQFRAKCRVFFNKHFLRHKYAYRDEWLRFTDLLSQSDNPGELRYNVIGGIARLVNAPSGVMLEREGRASTFAPTAAYEVPSPASLRVGSDDPVVAFMAEHGWVVDLEELRGNPSVYGDLPVPTWIDSIRKPWLVVPLVCASELEGFVVLSEPIVKNPLDWEDHDILKTVGRQAATHMAMVRVTDALSDAQKFDAFNRLSSYVVHDLKNVAAQLTLVASNSRRHLQNPEFVADAMATVENATNRMNRMLEQLKKGRLEQTTTKLVNLARVLEKVVKLRSDDRPQPTYQGWPDPVFVSADADKLATVVEHLVQNAQEATSATGDVVVTLKVEPNWAVVEVSDTGCGMDHQFVATRLFRPFETTKGNAGMGIGVYESREFVHMWGGDMQVVSEVGEGSTFTLRFPTEAYELDRVEHAT